MAANEHSRDQNGLAAGKGGPEAGSPGVSSQAGLGTFRSRVRSLPSVPSPGQPGSRFSPVVVSREEAVARGTRAKGVGKKSLDIGMPSGMIQGVPPEILNPGGADGAEKQEPSVVGASAQGFVGGVMAGAQTNLGSGTPEVPSQGEVVPAATKEDAGTRVKAAPKPAVAHTNKVVMNPKHAAGLESLAGQQHDQLEGAGGRYGR